MVLRDCAHCRKTFEQGRGGSIYCSEPCKRKAANARTRAKTGNTEAEENERIAAIVQREGGPVHRVRHRHVLELTDSERAAAGLTAEDFENRVNAAKGPRRTILKEQLGRWIEVY